ncbi:MAG: hypothetical protein U0838_03545 [Chloroflexota bacterium]
MTSCPGRALRRSSQVFEGFDLGGFPTRRNMLMNLGFGSAIVALPADHGHRAFAVSWYGSHLAPAVKVATTRRSAWTT